MRDILCTYITFDTEFAYILTCVFFLKVLFTKVNHHNVSVRQDALQGLRDIFQSHPDLLPKHLPKLVEHVFVTLVDGSGAVRQASHLLMETLLSSVTRDVVSPFFETLIAHLNCGLTHIKEKIQLDSLKVLELYLKYCPGLLVAYVGSLHWVLLGLLSRRKPVSAYCGAVSKAKKKSRSLIGILGQGARGNATYLDNPSSSLLNKGTRLRVLKLISGLLELMLEATPGSHFPMSSPHSVSFVEVAGALASVLVESWVESHPDDVLQGKCCPVQSLLLMETVIATLCVLLKLLLRLTQDSELEKVEEKAVMVDCCKKISGDISSHFLCHFPFGVMANSSRLQHFHALNFTFCEIALLLWKLSALVKAKITDTSTLVVMQYLSNLNSSDITSVQNPTCSRIVANLASFVYSFSLACSEAEDVLVGGVFRFIRDYYFSCHPHSRSKQLLVKCFSAMFREELERHASE